MPFDPGIDELRVMNSLIHPDGLATIMAETGLTCKVSIDIVRNLFHYGFLKPMSRENRPMPSFDVDKIDRVKFTLTGKGLQYWEENSFRLRPG